MLTRSGAVIDDVRAWTVTQDMPTLRRSGLPQEAVKVIGSVKYELKLEGLSRFSANADDCLAGLLEMTTAS